MNTEPEVKPYQPNTTVDFDITGMTCAACATRIEKGLSKMPGVAQASVNLAMETARIVYHPSEVTPDDMQARVAKLGYEAALKREQVETSEHRTREIQKQKHKLWISALLSFPLLWAMVSHFSFTSWIWLPELLMNPWMQLVKIIQQPLKLKITFNRLRAG